MEFLVQKIVDPIADVLIGTVKREAGYLVFSKKNVKELEDKTEELGDVCRRVKEEVKRDKNNARDIKEEVNKWLGKADKMQEEVQKFVGEAHNRENRTCCFNVQCPDLNSRFRFGRQARKKIEEVTKLIEADKFDTVSYQPILGDNIGLPSTTDYENFESRALVFNEILGALRDKAVNVVGIYGAGGVGKTKMVGKIEEEARKEKLFDQVTMAVVSQDLEVRKIQDELAVRLNLDLSGAGTELGRAGLLKKRLKDDERKILVILDDVWEKLDLKKIIEIEFKDKDFKGCKFLLTSRRRRVCDDNSCQKSVFINFLSEMEAWNMFKKKAGNCVDTTDIHPVAEDVCKECGGLPLIIQAVGAALKDKGGPIWRDALHCFQNYHPQDIGEIDPKAYVRLELSYNMLSHEEEKSCLLLCSLFPEDTEISIVDLSRHAKANGFLKDVDKLEEARDRMISTVDILKDSSLLLQGRDEGTIKMHDVIRDVAISIASKDKKYKFLVKTGGRKWPEMDNTNGGH